jgi:hypothetical protein
MTTKNQKRPKVQYPWSEPALSVVLFHILTAGESQRMTDGSVLGGRGHSIMPIVFAARAKRGCDRQVADTPAVRAFYTFRAGRSNPAGTTVQLPDDPRSLPRRGLGQLRFLPARPICRPPELGHRTTVMVSRDEEIPLAHSRTATVDWSYGLNPFNPDGRFFYPLAAKSSSANETGQSYQPYSTSLRLNCFWRWARAHQISNRPLVVAGALDTAA